MSPRNALMAFALLAPVCAGIPAVRAQSAPPADGQQPAAQKQTEKAPATIKPASSGVRAPVRREVPLGQRRVVKSHKSQAETAPVSPAGPVAAPAAAAAALAAGTPAVPTQSPSTNVPPGTAPAATAPVPPSGWTEAEIKLAQTHCSAVLKGVDAVFVHEAPIKQGECGAPAVVLLSSIGKGPEITISPPVQLTCDMVAALHKWIKSDVQPQARAQLGSPVVKIETMSSYSCRTAYGRARGKLSEHGKANAIDIGGFTTAKTETVALLTGWGMTERETKALAAKAEAVRIAAEAAARAKQQPTGQPGSTPPSIASGSIHSAPGTSGTPGVIIRVPGLSPSGTPNAFGLAPDRLGGPKQAGVAADKTTAPVQPDADPRRSRFLRAIHASACKHFGTVLGPEANNAHKNHFHLDMAPRPRSNFCE